MLLLALTLSAQAFETSEAAHLEIKWMRDSVEYRALTRQIYRTAEATVLAQAKRLKRNDAWAVVLDVDETALDNSTYFLDRAAYRLPFDWQSWDAWAERRQAPAIPGAKAFVDAVREAGGRVAWITNRSDRTTEATRDNLADVGLWGEGDALCTLTADEAYTKRVRRTELRDGTGPCGWAGTPVQVLAYLGDTIHDLPEEGEDGVMFEQLGLRFFVLPNPAYGGWEHRVTWYPEP